MLVVRVSICLPVSVCNSGGYRSPLQPSPRSLLGSVSFTSVDVTTASDLMFTISNASFKVIIVKE